MGKKSTQKRQAENQPVATGNQLLTQNAGAKPWLKWQSLAIFLSVFVLYANTLGNQYALDDMIVLTKNTFTQQGIAGIDEIMTTDAFEGFFGKNFAFVVGGRYRPLSIATFAIEYELFGLKNPWVYHLNNIILYGLTCVLILLTLQKLFRARFEGDSPWLTVPFIATLIFAAHPIHTEAVANIKGRDEIMGMLGSIAALYLCVRYIETNKLWYAFAALPVFVLAILSKENAITFLAVIPLAYYFFYSKKTVAKGLSITASLAMAVGLYFVIRTSFLSAPSISGKTYEILNDPFAFSTVSERLATVAFTFGKYLQLLIFPHPLTHDYYPWQVPIYNWGDWQALLPTAFFLGVGAYTVYGTIKRDPIAFGVLYFFITISIVSNILFSVGIAMNERFVFMPSLGFAIIAAILLVKVTNYLKTKNWSYNKVLNAKPLMIILGIIMLGYSIKTISRNPVWENDFTLFGNDVKLSPNSAKVANAWGGELYTASDTAGTPARAKEYLDKAEASLKRALEIYPQYSNAWLLLGNVAYKKNNDYKTAKEYYLKAKEFNPNSFDAHYNLAIAYRDLNMFKDALLYLDMAVALKPEKAETVRQNRAEVFYRWGKYAGQTQGNLTLATEKINEAIKINPTAVYYYEDLGVAYGLMGDYQMAIKTCEAGLKLDPKYKPFYQNLVNSYIALGQEAKAQEYADKLNQLNAQTPVKPN